jgi:hypothetical protein
VQRKQLVPSMQTDNRKFARRNIDLVVQIETDDGSTVDGSLLDLSRGGVRVKVPNSDRLPEQFLLKLSDQIHRRSRIAWRSDEEIGVEFLSAPQIPADGEAERSILIRCPRTGRSIATGIRLTMADDLGKLPDVRRFSQCPNCKVVHGWTLSDASLAPVTRTRPV